MKYAQQRVNEHTMILLTVFVFFVACMGCQQPAKENGTAEVKTRPDVSKDIANDSITVDTATNEDQNVPLPKSIFPELTHDFGEVEQGAELVYPFKVLNKGEGPLRILSVKPS